MKKKKRKHSANTPRKKKNTQIKDFFWGSQPTNLWKYPQNFKQTFLFIRHLYSAGACTHQVEWISGIYGKGRKSPVDRRQPKSLMDDLTQGRHRLKAKCFWLAGVGYLREQWVLLFQRAGLKVRAKFGGLMGEQVRQRLRCWGDFPPHKKSANEKQSLSWGAK